MAGPLRCGRSRAARSAGAGLEFSSRGLPSSDPPIPARGCRPGLQLDRSHPEACVPVGLEGVPWGSPPCPLAQGVRTLLGGSRRRPRPTGVGSPWAPTHLLSAGSSGSSVHGAGDGTWRVGWL